jgi:DNA-binding CsgD family transcriptional regulator
MRGDDRARDMGGENDDQWDRGPRRRREPSPNSVEALKALKSLPVSVAILDRAGSIVAVNAAWRAFGRRNRLLMPGYGVGANYIQYSASDEPHSARFVDNLRQLLAGQLDLVTTIYPCHSPNEQRWFSLIGLPLSLDRTAGVALMHINLTQTLPLPILAGRSASGLDAIGDVVARTVSTALASQLTDMLSPLARQPTRDGALRRSEAEDTLADAGLSKRQTQILHLLGEGKDNSEIAAALARSPNTIKLHVSAILKKLKLKSRTQAALLASTLPKAVSTS